MAFCFISKIPSATCMYLIQQQILIMVEANIVDGTFVKLEEFVFCKACLIQETYFVVYVLL